MVGGASRITITAMVFGLLVLSGCEDMQARSTASDASKQLDALKAQIAEVESKAAENSKRLQELQDKLVTALNDRMDKVTDQVATSTKEFLERVSKDSESMRRNVAETAQSARTDFDAALNSAKTTLAGDIQKIRDENKATFEELKLFMDNQLKELYPYAYQPRRLPAATEAK